LGSAPSLSPSSSLSLSVGLVPIAASSASDKPSPSVSVRGATRSSAFTLGSFSPASTLPFLSKSSAPSDSPPRSVSLSRALVWVNGSASARKLPLVTSVSADGGVATPTSVPSKSPSLSESGSSALINPAPSVSRL
jgi:hypothetical protein